MVKNFTIFFILAILFQSYETAFIHGPKPDVRPSERISVKEFLGWFNWVTWIQSNLVDDYITPKNLNGEESDQKICGNRLEFYYGNCILHPRRIYL